MNKIGIAKIFLSLFVISCFCCSQANVTNNKNDEYLVFLNTHGNPITENFHLPIGDDLSYWGTDPNTFFYKTTDNTDNHKAPYWTKGDFNYDGIIDRVYILFNNDRDNKAKIFAFVSKEKQFYNIKDLSYAQKNMGVSTIKLKRNQKTIDALKIFEFEGHAATYIWNVKSNNFVKFPNN